VLQGKDACEGLEHCKRALVLAMSHIVFLQQTLHQHERGSWEEGDHDISGQGRSPEGSDQLLTDDESESVPSSHDSSSLIAGLQQSWTRIASCVRILLRTTASINGSDHCLGSAFHSCMLSNLYYFLFNFRI
jgi:hypothetical protein